MSAADRRLITWLVAPITVIVLIVVIVLLSASGPASASDKRTAAVVALIGVLVPAVTSIIGITFRRQSDRRLELDREQSERRLELEHKDNEERLRLEAAMHAGSLFNANGDSPADPAAIASGLLALTRLGRADLAVALLVDLWNARSLARQEPAATSTDPPPGPSGSDNTCPVSNETAVLVLDDALRSTPNAQLVAAELLCRKAATLDLCQSLHWPSEVDGRWNPAFDVRTKVLIVDALVHMAIAREASQNALQFLTVRLFSISAGDPNPHVKGCIGMLLAALMPALERTHVKSLMQGRTEIMIDQVRSAARDARANPDLVFYKVAKDRAAKLADWSKGCEDVDCAPGALAAAAMISPNGQIAETRLAT